MVGVICVCCCICASGVSLTPPLSPSEHQAAGSGHRSSRTYELQEEFLPSLLLKDRDFYLTCHGGPPPLLFTSTARLFIFPASNSQLPCLPKLLHLKCQWYTPAVWWDETMPALCDAHQHRPLVALLANLCPLPCGSGARARWQRARPRGGEQLGRQHWTDDHYCWQALQDGVPEPYVSEVHSRTAHLETRTQDCVLWLSLYVRCFRVRHIFWAAFFCPFFSKMENRLQRRPRSTSMKDRQNSKAQSDRTSSMESECSPDSRLIAQVNNTQM